MSPWVRCMIGPCGQARSHAGEPPSGGESCVKTMRPRSSSVRSQRLFKASSACSGHASVQVGSWDRRRACIGSVLRARLHVCARGLWRALAGGSSKQVSRRSLARHWGGRGWSRRLRLLRAVRVLPCRKCLRLVRGARPALLSVASASLSSTVGSPTSPACAVSLSWWLPPWCGRPWAGCSSRASGRRRVACASSSSRRPGRSWRRREPRPGPCPVVSSSSP